MENKSQSYSVHEKEHTPSQANAIQLKWKMRSKQQNEIK